MFSNCIERLGHKKTKKPQKTPNNNNNNNNNKQTKKNQGKYKQIKKWE